MKFIYYFLIITTLFCLISSCSRQVNQIDIDELLLYSEWDSYTIHCDSFDIDSPEVTPYIFGRQGEDGYNENFEGNPQKRFLYTINIKEDNSRQLNINIRELPNNIIRTFQIIDYNENKMTWYQANNENYCLRELIRTK